MVYNPSGKWAIGVLLSFTKITFTQVVGPLGGGFLNYPPQFPAVYGVGQVHQFMAVPVIQPMPTTTPTTTTTTTTERSQAVALPFPVPMPMPVQVAIPFPQLPFQCQGSPRPKGCPPCPPCVCMPSCTPAFFSYCSPCHLKCRCPKREDTPIPLPPPQYPMVPFVPAPPPVMIFPFPMMPKRPQPESDTSSCTSVESSSSECEYKNAGIKLKRRRPRRPRNLRRQGKELESDSDIVKPELTYISKNGEVKYKKKLTNDEAEELLRGRKNDRKEYQFIRVTAVNGPAKRKSNELNRNMGKYREVLLRDRPTVHDLDSGRKELVFRAPVDKTLSNLSISFQIT
ncbi:uncharacterized protein LOC126974558 isoform X1 [Leptidea sinapis]|uniref:uncharacterized protein LOC126974558 isoform X1 n=2 Tax=Leptidea sinapis TaxID=189913 RepID=UPI0021317501|nr:uncharacterized protein LOC126974558 isoform X1 [Leptidea sinapis]